MDLSSLMGVNKHEEEQKASFEYTAQTASPIVSGEVKLTIEENSVTITSLFDTIEIAFAEINALSFADYVVTVKTDSGDFPFCRMGSWAQPFYDALRDAYNKAVLRSLFIKGSPILTARGDFRYSEKGINGGGAASIHVYENNVTALTPNLSARRLPLCFVTGMEKGDYELTLKLDPGESYTFAKLGYDTAHFSDAVEKQIQALRNKSLAAIKELDPTLTAAQASQVARLMPEGAAATFGQLAQIAPSFVASLEEKLANTRATEYYAVFKTLRDPAQIYVGFRKNDTGAESGALPNMGGIHDGLGDGGNSMETLSNLKNVKTPAGSGKTGEPTPDPYLLWMIAPSPDGQYASVEFTEANSATFVYKTGGDFDGFARQLNRALEAISFKREVILMADDELCKPENSDYYMAAKRTMSLQFIRSNFTGRIIHSSLESWKRKLLELWSGM